MILKGAYTPTIWLPVFAVLFLSFLAAYSWRRRSVPGALPLMAACLFAALWSVGYAMEIAMVDAAAKAFWIKFQACWSLPTGMATACFILEYTWPGRWLTRRNLILLTIAPLLFLGLILTNHLHHWIWPGYMTDPAVALIFGPGAWIFLGYDYLLGIVMMCVLTWLFVRSPQQRWPVFILLFSLVLARVAFLLQPAGIVRSHLPIGLLVQSTAFLLRGIALFGFRIFDPLPAARQTVIEQIRAGMLVVDPRGRVVSLNPAAEQMLGVTAKQAKDKAVRELLPTCPEGLPAELGGSEIEFSLLAEQGVRYFTMAVSLLKDWRGQEVGCMLLLRDVTEQKRAQAQILEQQRALAMLSEREHLARELHDSLGQVLGYAGFQLEAVQGQIQDGQAAITNGQVAGGGLASAGANLAEAGSQLQRLSSVVEEAHADVREYILNLRLAPSDERPFFATLQRYLDGFSQNYGIQAVLSLGPGIGEETFEPEAQMQLYRIIQEALSNARKHAGASRVVVTFARQDSRAYIRIQDNGCGFDPAQSPAGGHFCLRFMHERAGELGGRLQVQSAPGEGTCVEVEIPGNLMQSR